MKNRIIVRFAENCWAGCLYSSKMIATKQTRKNRKLDSEHNIENTVTYTLT